MCIRDRLQVLKLTHETNYQHNSYKKTLQMVSKYFYWPKMKRCIKKFVQFCPACRDAKNREFSIGDLVYVTKLPEGAELGSSWEDSVRILQRLGVTKYLVQMKGLGNKSVICHVNRMKLYPPAAAYIVKQFLIKQIGR